jgi:dynein heavy chain
MAYANFDETKWAPCGDNQKKVNACKNHLFALCVFHTLLLGRKKFGCVGWIRTYPFNTGDLTISSYIMVAYIRDSDTVPYADLRFIFGEIMYGGHITDPWDRRLDNTYLSVMIGEHTQEGYEIMPGFPMPNPTETDYDGYSAQIEEAMPQEDPTMYGLHPNAGIGNLMNATSDLFDSIMTLQGSDRAGSATAATAMAEILAMLPVPGDFNTREIKGRIEANTRAPYVLVMLQEVEHMNTLLGTLRQSLKEVTPDGSVGMSLSLNAVPECWHSVSYPSRKTLAAWWRDLLDRHEQLTVWSGALTKGSINMPNSVWISGLFNGQAFLVSVKQTSARRDQLPLDTMDLLSDITKIASAEQVDGPVEDGCLVDGFFVEGARWNSEEGCLADSFLKDLHPALPVMHVFSRAAPSYEDRVGAMSGGLRVPSEYYECPAFITSDRGATFVFGATMKMAEGDKASKWVLAAVALLMSEE